MKWSRIIVGAVAAFAGSMLITAGIVAVYAFKLGAQAQGAPDPDKIREFAQHVGPTWGPLLLPCVTVLAAFWVARRATVLPVRHALFMGILTALMGIAISLPLDLRDMLTVVGALVAAFIGGQAGAAWRRRKVSDAR